MLNSRFNFGALFKSEPQVIDKEPIYEKAVTKNKTTNEIIEEIHESFYTEVDKLLASAKISKSLETDKQDLIDKCERLKKLGFSNSKEVKDAEAELQRLRDLKTENENKKDLIEAINHFSFKYPNYKFITEDSVKKICAKYNLVYGGIDRYIGTVPDKNLKHIEEFDIKDEDKPWLRTITSDSIYRNDQTNIVSHQSYKNYLSEKERQKEIEKNDPEMYHRRMMMDVMRGRDIYTKCPLEIAAPITDFNMNQMEIKDFQLSKVHIPDPVVLQPVMFNSKKHYLIVTAWGTEGEDELVVNQKFN
jgi:hypothetical protein